MKTSLKSLRKEIDALDTELLEILAKRMEVVREIGKIKKEENLPILDSKRWREVVRSRLLQADTLHLPHILIKKIFQIIHKHSLQLERNEK